MPKGKNISRADPGKEFVKIVESMAYSRSRRDVFNDFVEMAYCSLRQLVDPKDEIEKRYMGIIKRYKPEEVREKLPKLMSLTTIAVSAGGSDFLGHAGGLMELFAGNDQFFTPYSIARFMAEIILAEVEEVIERQGVVTMQEPACGAGALAIAAADVVETKGFKLNEHLYVEAIDVALICYQMTYVQLSLRGVAAIVRHGNTLSNQYWDSIYTAAMFPIVYEKLLKLRAARAVEEKEPLSPTMTATTNLGQIGFDFMPARKEQGTE